MRKTHLKLIIWILLAILATAGFWASVSGIANLLAYFQRGAEPASALNIVPNVPPDLHVALSWDADGDDIGRPIEAFTRSQVEATYLRAWLQWNLSYMKGEPHGLTTYFTGPARSEISAAVRRATADGLRIAQTNTAHRLQLHFYSADGTVVAFTDHDVPIAQVIRAQSGTILSVGATRADYDVVMLLEDGEWRIRHLVRRAATPPPALQVPPCPTCVTASGTGLELEGVPFHVMGINYYPQATPWDTFWPQYSPAVIDRDLSRIKGLGLNTIRIFIPYEQFGGPRVDLVMLDRLGDLLDRAQAQDLKVIVTLFDFRADYGLLQWASADRHLEAILPRFATHPAILMWDLKNEPDLDDKVSGAPIVDAWLAHTVTLVRRLAPHHLVTIGWSSPMAARRLADQVDIVQFHYYAPVVEFAPAYAALRTEVPDRPVLLGEFGLPTWNSVFPHGHTEAEQAVYYADLLTAMREVDAVGTLAWTLYDFTHVPATVAGRWPWQTGPQAHMGVIRADGREKPAAALLAPGAVLDVPPVPGWARWLKPFWLLVAGGIIAVTAGGVWLTRLHAKAQRR
ncbi:cellulase family glycosylhydrolase [Candidatus Chloroploca sp. M-50]|uniref:mannan endo-1,4-beta-mannosidase n=1 Tax=Candidatus Chloroploca mongolica TaxID=2528176 RepID=A0ABS4D652_9CHLR|nr:cellulase family glycosylhydrolase [Candidatus Chloroploca mongolica]MBP1464904.1 cellulase family glycosylhydrolase [Candidatus Chloroploca mongolica]